MDRMEFNVEMNSALLIVDMQNAFIHPEGSLSKMGLDTSRTLRAVEPIRQLKEAFEAKKRPVIYIQHINGANQLNAGLVTDVYPSDIEFKHCVVNTWDSQIVDDLSPNEKDFVITKKHFSGFYQTELNDLLANLGIDTLVITGVSTNMAVESTVKDAFHRGYNVFIPEEATVSYTEEQEQIALNNFDFTYGRVIKVKELLYEMLVLVA